MSEWLDGFSMAWGMFLAIPCPLRRWNEKAREKMLVCLPLVGLAVGGIWLGLYLLLRHAAIGVTSITNRADGRRVRSAIEPKVLSNFAR